MQPPSPREIRWIRDHLMAEYAEAVDMSSAGGLKPSTEQMFLSRALAALVVRKVLGCGKEEAALGVIDGPNDLGIDAVAVSDSGLGIWLIQTKWSDVGKDSFNLAEVLKFRDGLVALDQKDFVRFNTRLQRHADRIDAAWGRPGLKITMLVATVGAGVLTHDVTTRFTQMKADFNSRGDDPLDYAAWGLTQILEIVKDEQQPPSITLPATLTEWAHLAGPFEAYQGRVAVGNVAEWLTEHEDRLFEQNIRKNLGVTKVNQGLVETLTTRPEDFWYFNNGITVLCRTAERDGGSYNSRQPIKLQLSDASVVNGAQTVAAIHAAMQQAPDKAADAFVTVKIVTTKNCPDDFGSDVTRFTNTQNQVVSQDFVALDRAQWEIRQDFRISLHLDYTYKRGESEPEGAEGCSVVQAATALACAHNNCELVVRARQSRDRLWENDDKGAYTLLFGARRPSAIQIWRSVLIVRAVREALKQASGRLEGKASAIADLGDLLLIHLVFRQLDTDDIDEPDVDWDAVVARAAEVTAPTLDWLIHHVDAAFGPDSFANGIFVSEPRCRILVDRVMGSITSGQHAPDLPSAYVPPPRSERPRRRNAVPTLVDAGVIADGEILYFRTQGQREEAALTPWVLGHPEGFRARWVNHRTRPLIWEYDRKQYSPTGLVNAIWSLAGWRDHPVAVQGPDRWSFPDRGTLWELAKAIQDQDSDEALF